jgi:aryl-alcohol dehydrogenase-like predicted oxidoreductase
VSSSVHRTSAKTSRIGLGCTTFGREIPEAVAFALMDYAVDHGITLFDTAEAYGGGQARDTRRRLLGVEDTREVSHEMHSSEKIIGRWLRTRGSRDRITLVTKTSRNFRIAQVRTSLEASLQRLQTDHVEQYLYHSYDPNTPVDEANRAMDAVIKAGLTRMGGCSNYNADQLQAALEDSKQAGLARCEVVQLGYNLLKAPDEVFKIIAREKLSYQAYSPLAAGFLSGKYTPDRSAIPKGTRFDVIPAHADIYFSDRNFRRVVLLQQLAQKTGVPPLQLAMAWVFQNPLVTTVLVGARTQAHLTNALAAEKLFFPPEWLDEIQRWNNAAPEASSGLSFPQAPNIGSST